MLTHQHLDHIGLVEIIAGRSGAEVAAWHLLGPYLENFAASDGRRRRVRRRRSCGATASRTTRMSRWRSAVAAFRAFGSSAKVTRPLQDGDTLELEGRTLRRLHRPGHSPSDTIFWDAGRRILFSGDHLIGHISSNPLVTRPLDGGSDARRGPRRWSPTSTSMKATRELPAELVLPGHGDPVDRPRGADRRAPAHAPSAAPTRSSGCSTSGR